MERCAWLGFIMYLRFDKLKNECAVVFGGSESDDMALLSLLLDLRFLYVDGSVACVCISIGEFDLFIFTSAPWKFV
jgi:hypothetical protein